eukprot:313432_1
MVKFDDQAATLIEAIVYIIIDLIVIGLSVWMGTSLWWNNRSQNGNDGPKLNPILVYVPLIYYLVAIIGSILAIIFDITFQDIYLNIFAVLFSINRLLLALFLFIRLYISFKISEMYALSKKKITLLSVIFGLCAIAFICYTIKCLLKLHNPTMIDDIAFAFIITAMFLDSIFTIIIAYLFFSTLFAMVLVAQRNDNPRPKLIDVITKHTFLCCIASFTIQLATMLRLITYLTPSLYGSPYKVVTLAIFHGISYIAALFSIHLSFQFADKHYVCMCKYCDKQCHKYCIWMVQQRIQQNAPTRMKTVEQQYEL